MDVDLKVTGLDELERQLKRLTVEMGEKTLHQALMFAALPVKKRAKALAPLGPTGNLRKSIKSRRMRAGKSRRATLKGVNAVSGASAGVYVFVDFKTAPHAHLVHWGTSSRYTQGKGRKRPYKNAHRGRTRGTPFLLKAWDETGGQNSVDRFKTKLKRNIDKVAK